MRDDLDSWHSYPSIYALGHKALATLFDCAVIVEEKIDGSQFSFGCFDDGVRCRSKGAQINIIAPEKMFMAAVETVGSLPLHHGWTYRAEYLARPKHNTLAYERIPVKHLMIFDINTGHETYLSPEEKETESRRLGLECVPLLYRGAVTNGTMFREMLDQTSCLGGQKIEGVVVKNYDRFGPDKKALMGKFVSEAFKEIHSRTWRENKPTNKDIIDRLIERYKTPARWNKAIQRLRDAGVLEQSPRDIGAIMRDVWPDIEKECKDEIVDTLYTWAAPRLRRGVTRGLPEWYKEQLLAQQFESDE